MGLCDGTGTSLRKQDGTGKTNLSSGTALGLCDGTGTALRKQDDTGKTNLTSGTAVGLCDGTGTSNELRLHHDNMSMKCITPATPILYRKTGVCGGIPIFLTLAPNRRLWVLVTCTHNLCF